MSSSSLAFLFFLAVNQESTANAYCSQVKSWYDPFVIGHLSTSLYPVPLNDSKVVVGLSLFDQFKNPPYSSLSPAFHAL